LCLRPGWEVEVLTSCALDHLTWENTEPPGTFLLNGVTVRRFPTASRRTLEYFALDAKLRVAPGTATLDQSRRWVALNGPVCPDLVDAVASADADVVACYPYLFATTVDAVAVSRSPVVLHPAAHDEPALRLPVFPRVFDAADGLVFQTGAERDLVERLFPVATHHQLLLGLGVDDPDDPALAVDPGGPAPGPPAVPPGCPYLVCLGRVDGHKGTTMLATFFARYKAHRPGPLRLVLAGPVVEPPAPHPEIDLLGPVGDATKWELLRSAAVLVSPSPWEAFSLVVAEAWSARTPVLVNAACGATVEQCVRSGGGLRFGGYGEFEVALDLLLGDPEVRGGLGSRGRAYVDHRFRWPLVTDRYAAFVESVAERGPRPR